MVETCFDPRVETLLAGSRASKTVQGDLMPVRPFVDPESRSKELRHYHRNREEVLAKKRAIRESNNPWIKKECRLCGELFSIRQNNSVRRYCGSKCKARANNLRAYGLTVEDYRTLVGDGKCCICQRKIRKWHVDHDHKTLETWGVICSLCNMRVVAGVRRNADTVRRLLAYVESPPARLIDGRPRMTNPKAISSGWSNTGNKEY